MNHKIFSAFIISSLLFGALPVSATGCEVPSSQLEIVSLGFPVGAPTPSLGNPITLNLTVKNNGSTATSTSFVIDGFKNSIPVIHIASNLTTVGAGATIAIPFTFTISEAGMYDFAAGAYTEAGCLFKYVKNLLSIVITANECPTNCEPIGRDPGVIRFGRNGNADTFIVHGSLSPKTAINPATEPITLKLVNADGTIYSITIPAGTIQQNDKFLWTFFDRMATRNKTGLGEVRINWRPSENHYEFRIESYGNLSKATLANMSLTLTVGDDTFFNKSDWKKTTAGWGLEFNG